MYTSVILAVWGWGCLKKYIPDPLKLLFPANVVELSIMGFVRELGRRIHQETGEEMATSCYLILRLSMASQRVNVAAVLESYMYASVIVSF